MGVPLNHVQGLMAEHLLDFPKPATRHRQIGSIGVAQVVKAEVFDAGPLQGGGPTFFQIREVIAQFTWKDQAVFAPLVV